MQEDKQDTIPVVQEPEIKIERSIIYRGRVAKENHVWFIAIHDNKKKKEKYQYAEMHSTKDLYLFQELAIKGNLVKRMRAKFKF